MHRGRHGGGRRPQRCGALLVDPRYTGRRETGSFNSWVLCLHSNNCFLRKLDDVLLLRLCSFYWGLASYLCLGCCEYGILLFQDYEVQHLYFSLNGVALKSLFFIRVYLTNTDITRFRCFLFWFYCEPIFYVIFGKIYDAKSNS